MTKLLQFEWRPQSPTTKLEELHNGKTKHRVPRQSATQQSTKLAEGGFGNVALGLGCVGRTTTLPPPHHQRYVCLRSGMPFGGPFL